MSKLNFTPFPVLTTERLILRCLELSDDQLLFKLRSNENVNKYIVRPIQKDIKEIRAFISKINDEINNNDWIYWVISLKDDPTLIGDICLWNFSDDKTVAEIGYELDPAFHGKGIMSEALEKIIEFGFKEIELNTIEAYTHKKNNDSTKILQKYNFKQDVERVDKENTENIIFTLSKQNWIEE
jgi:ribosomal-protein-alanine N-acetyltransferase